MKTLEGQLGLALFERVGRRARLTPAGAHLVAEQRFIVFDADLAMHRTWWRATFGARAPLAPRLGARVANLDEMLALAEAGLGVTVLPNYFVEPALSAGRVARVGPRTPAGRWARNVLYLAWRKNAVETARFTT